MPNVTMETAFSAKWWKEELINALNKVMQLDRFDLINI